MSWLAEKLAEKFVYQVTLDPNATQQKGPFMSVIDEWLVVKEQSL